MELELTRKTRTANSTIGELKVNGTFECFILEDFDRGLTKDMALAEINNIKVKGKTCIPAGRYEIVVSFSNKFQKQLPLLQDVPGFAGIRIHSGNAPKDTLGCLLPGKSKSTDMVLESRVAFNKLFNDIKKSMKTEKVFITIK